MARFLGSDVVRCLLLTELEGIVLVTLFVLRIGPGSFAVRGPRGLQLLFVLTVWKRQCCRPKQYFTFSGREQVKVDADMAYQYNQGRHPSIGQPSLPAQISLNHCL